MNSTASIFALPATCTIIPFIFKTIAEPEICSVAHRFVVLIVLSYLNLLLLVLGNALNDKVWVGFHGELLEAHVHVGVNCVEILEFFTSKEAVILSLVLNLAVYFSIECSTSS